MTMASLKRSEIRFIDEVFNMKDGYPLDFSNRTFAEFFEDEFKIDIYADNYSGRGTSKANRLRCFIETQDGYLVGKALRRLWEYRTETFVAADVSRALPPAVENRFFELVGRIEAGFAPPVLGSLSGVAETLDFDTVTRDLDRALASAKEADPFRCDSHYSGWRRTRGIITFDPRRRAAVRLRQDQALRVAKDRTDTSRPVWRPYNDTDDGA
jgi:hypothetical protein